MLFHLHLDIRCGQVAMCAVSDWRQVELPPSCLRVALRLSSAASILLFPPLLTCLRVNESTSSAIRAAPPLLTILHPGENSCISQVSRNQKLLICFVTSEIGQAHILNLLLSLNMKCKHQQIGVQFSCKSSNEVQEGRLAPNAVERQALGGLRLCFYSALPCALLICATMYMS